MYEEEWMSMDVNTRCKFVAVYVNDLAIALNKQGLKGIHLALRPTPY